MILRKCSRSSRSSSSTALPDAVPSAFGSRGCCCCCRRRRRSSLSGVARSASASPPMPLAVSPGHGSCSRSSSRPRRGPLRITLAGGSLSLWGRGLGSGAFRDTAHVADIPRALLRPRARPARTRITTLPASAAKPTQEGIARGGGAGAEHAHPADGGRRCRASVTVIRRCVLSRLPSRCHRDWEQCTGRALPGPEPVGVTGDTVRGVVPVPAVWSGTAGPARWRQWCWSTSGLPGEDAQLQGSSGYPDTGTGSALRARLSARLPAPGWGQVYIQPRWQAAGATRSLCWQEALLHTLRQTQEAWCLLGRWARSNCGEGKARCLTIHESLNTRLPPTTTDFGLDDGQMIFLHLTKLVWLGADTMSCSKSHHTSFHCALRRGGWYKTISFIRAHPLTPKS